MLCGRDDVLAVPGFLMLSEKVCVVAFLVVLAQTW